MEQKNIIKKYTSEETKKYILNDTGTPYDIRYMLQKSAEKFSDFQNAEGKERGEKWNIFANYSMGVSRALETETCVGLMESVNEDYRGLAKEFSIQLVKDYNCKTSLEKALAEVVTNSYIRIIDNSRRLNNELNCKNITQNRTSYIVMLSKQVDKANRQFLNALMTLKQLKAPNIEMNIKTTNAFVAQNQQINTDYPSRSDSNENVESK